MGEKSFQKVGQTALGEAIYQDEHGQLYVEKDYERLEKATLQELAGAKFYEPKRPPERGRAPLPGNRGEALRALLEKELKYLHSSSKALCVEVAKLFESAHTVTLLAERLKGYHSGQGSQD